MDIGVRSELINKMYMFAFDDIFRVKPLHTLEYILPIIDIIKVTWNNYVVYNLLHIMFPRKVIKNTLLKLIVLKIFLKNNKI